MKTKGLRGNFVRRALSLICLFVLITASSYAQFSMNRMDNSTAVAHCDPARQASTDVDAAIYKPAGSVTTVDCPISYYTNMKYNVAVGVNYRF